MNWFDTIKRYYNRTPQLWTKKMVGDAVLAGKITEAEYKQITGDKYVASTTDAE